MYNQQQKNQPVFKTKDGNISGAVFDGKFGLSPSLQRYIYNRETGESRNETIYPNENQLMQIVFVCLELKRWLAAHPQPKQQNPQQGGQQVPNPQQHGQTLQYNPPQPPTGGTQYPQNHPFG